MASTLISVLDVVRAWLVEGPAPVLPVGTAKPLNCVYHANYTEYSFRVTDSNDLPGLKQQFKRSVSFP